MSINIEVNFSGYVDLLRNTGMEISTVNEENRLFLSGLVHFLPESFQSLSFVASGIAVLTFQTVDQVTLAIKALDKPELKLSVSVEGIRVGLYEKLSVARLMQEDESLSGKDYLIHSRAITKGRANREACRFYAQEQNWHLLPIEDKDGPISEICFVDGLDNFGDPDNNYIPYLKHHGNKWQELIRNADDNYYSIHLIADPVRKR